MRLRLKNREKLFQGLVELVLAVEGDSQFVAEDGILGLARKPFSEIARVNRISAVSKPSWAWVAAGAENNTTKRATILTKAVRGFKESGAPKRPDA